MSQQCLNCEGCDTTLHVIGGDRPHAPLDLAFAHLLDNQLLNRSVRLDPENLTGPLTIWASYSNHTRSRYHYVFGTDAADIYPNDLLLAESDTGQAYLAVTIAETPQSSTETGSVTWGSAAAVQFVTPTTPLKLVVPTALGATNASVGTMNLRDKGVVPFSYVLLAPIAATQEVVMLGELDKVVPASTHRFHELQPGEWALSGAPTETVDVSFAAKGALDAAPGECHRVGWLNCATNIDYTN